MSKTSSPAFARLFRLYALQFHFCSITHLQPFIFGGFFFFLFNLKFKIKHAYRKSVPFKCMQRIILEWVLCTSIQIEELAVYTKATVYPSATHSLFQEHFSSLLLFPFIFNCPLDLCGGNTPTVKHKGAALPRALPPRAAMRGCPCRLGFSLLQDPRLRTIHGTKSSSKKVSPASELGPWPWVYGGIRFGKVWASFRLSRQLYLCNDICNK